MAINVPQSGAIITTTQITDAHAQVRAVLNAIPAANIRPNTFGSMHLASHVTGMDFDNDVAAVTLNTAPAAFTEASQSTNWQKLGAYTRNPAINLIAEDKILLWWQVHLKEWSADPSGNEMAFFSPWITIEGIEQTARKWNKTHANEPIRNATHTLTIPGAKLGDFLSGVVLVEVTDAVTLDSYGLYGALVNTGALTLNVAHGSIGVLILRSA